MGHGYSIGVLQRNQEQPDTNIGVRLGRTCIDKGIPVSDVAHKFGVTKQTVYNWFRGSATPRPHVAADIDAFLRTFG
jgi:transcriptional regulator with XRE-family HTH domain